MSAVAEAEAPGAWAVTLAQPAFDVFVGAAPAVRSWDELLADVRALRHLTADWDGQGAEAPPAPVVDGAEALARAFRAAGSAPAARAIAGTSGTVLFEWHGPAGYVEVEVTGPNAAEGRWVPTGARRAVEFNLARGRM
jgi:hypothetical protein